MTTRSHILVLIVTLSSVLFIVRLVRRRQMRAKYSLLWLTTGGGLLVSPDDAEALAEGIYALWTDREHARVLGDRAYDGVRAHYTIGQSADRLLDVYRSIAADSVPVRGSVA